MDTALKESLAASVLTWADDEFFLAHRNSQWCGHAPILEEDIAFANLALDELGHAILWYQLYAALQNEDPETYPDQLVYSRSASEYRCAQFSALPNGDFAFSMLRQFLFDHLEAIRLARLAESRFEPLAETALKISREEIYHLRHARAWVRRLGLGTEESNRRMQAALDRLWPYVGQLFDRAESEERLTAEQILPGWQGIFAAWQTTVQQELAEAGLKMPEQAFKTLERRLPSQHVIDILAELQQVSRLDPNAVW